MSNQHNSPFDAVVVGAGFGGLGAALHLAEQGARVALCERLTYPGGCASTFERAGYRFEAGATLFSGFGEGQLFRRWIDTHDMDVEVEWLDPVIEFMTPEFRLDVPRDRDAFVRRIGELPGAPREQVAAFFREQSQVADALWAVLDDPSLVPPFGAQSVLRHLVRMPRYAPVVRSIGRPLAEVIRRHGLGDFRPLTAFLDAQAQITVQCGIEEAEGPLALAALDYCFRGTGHVVGGIGALASAIVSTIRRHGGEVFFAEDVRAIHTGSPLLHVETNRRTLATRDVVLNVLPTAARSLLDLPRGASERLDALDGRVREGWGACMLYIAARAPDGAPAGAQHVEIVQDPDRPLTEGNHLFCSIGSADESGRQPSGIRTMTVSTHVPLQWLNSIPRSQHADYVAGVQQRMRQGLHQFLGEWMENVVYEAPASPRTFERFTGRPGGYVGGVPRRAGLANYTGLFPEPVVPGVHLVGDSVFPGQSALATALGGATCARNILCA